MSGRMEDSDNQAARVFVGGVAANTGEQFLRERFSKHGNVNGKYFDDVARMYNTIIWYEHILICLFMPLHIPSFL